MCALALLEFTAFLLGLLLYGCRVGDEDKTRGSCLVPDATKMVSGTVAEDGRSTFGIERVCCGARGLGTMC